ncbi:hypothetical protein [Marinomonas pollencensis]|uniref:Membrane protein YqjE n=1 Tax=Marinomonas pollencensis TaxID=491954 RepID=A0A3E0DHJ3_9GAMM|nr:hypothetical protein [Marinomonas pollencensis]REG82194.1 hypothetical protein DFP81_11082 [Marinomonas pollencensis]
MKTTQATEQADFAELALSHKKWLKSVLGLGALEAKIWVTSSAQLLALIGGIVFLLITAWLLLIASAAALAWSYGFSLVSILLMATLVTLLSAAGLMYVARNTLKQMNFTRTLDALIPNDQDSSENA